MSDAEGRPGAAEDASLVTLSVAVYFVIALVPVAGLQTYGTAVPWGDVCVLIGGTLAAAAAARALALSPSAPRGVGVALAAHTVAAFATVAVCAWLLARSAAVVSVVDAGAFGRELLERAVVPLLPTQFVVGLATALLFRRLTRGVRARRAAWTIEQRAGHRTEWPTHRTLAALAAVSFLAVAIGVLYQLGIDTVPGAGVSASPKTRAGAVLVIIPLLTGTLAAASTASMISRATGRGAAGLGATIHFVTGTIATPAVIYVGMCALGLYDPRHPVEVSRIPGIVVGPLFAIPFFMPHFLLVLAAQTFVGFVATLLSWAVAHTLVLRDYHDS